MTSPDSSDIHAQRRWTVGYGVAISLWAMLWTLAFAPGESSPDTLAQYRQGLAGVYSDAHPVLYSWALGVSGSLVGNGSLVLYTQIGAGVVALCTLAWSLRAATPVAKTTLVLLSLDPLLWAQWTTLWKDEPLAICTLLTFALCLVGRPRWGLPLLVIATCFRHNGVTLVVPLAAWWGWHEARTQGRLRGAALGVVLLGSALAAPKLLDAALDAADGKAAAPTLVFDLAGAYTRDPGFHAASPFVDIPLEKIERRHRSHTARYLTSNRRGLKGLRHKDFDDARYTELKQEWGRLLTTRPDLWARHRAAFACDLLNVCMPTPMEPHGRTDKAYGIKVGWVDPERPLYRALNPLRAAFAPLARGWIWCLPTLVLGGLAVARRRWLEVAIASSGLAYLVGNVLLAPSAPFRYHLPLMLVVLVLAPHALHSGLTGPRAPDPAGPPA